MLGLGAWIASVHWYQFWLGVVRRGQSGSITPFLAGGLGAGGLLLMPWSGRTTWWWVPFMVDWGSVPFTIYTIAYVAWQAVRGKK